MLSVNDGKRLLGAKALTYDESFGETYRMEASWSRGHTSGQSRIHAIGVQTLNLDNFFKIFNSGAGQRPPVTTQP